MGKNKRLIIFALSLCVSIIFNCAYCADDTASNPVILSLSDAISIAFRNNKDIQIQEAEIAAAKADILGAKSEFLPKLNVQYGYTRRGAVLNSAILSALRFRKRLA